MSSKWIDVKAPANSKSKAPAATSAKKAAPPANPNSNKRAVTLSAAAIADGSDSGVTPTPNSPAPAAEALLDLLNESANGNSASVVGRTVSCLSGTQTPRARTPNKSYNNTNTNNEDPFCNTTASVDVGRSAQQQAPASPGRELNPHMAMSRYKATLHDIVTLLGNPSHVKMIDAFIDLTEEAVKDLKRLKVQSRTAPKAKTPSVPMAGAPATSASVERDSPADGDDGITPPAKANKSWASLLTKTNSSGALLRSPSKKELSLAQRHVDVNTDADRNASASRAEARRAEASERRGDKAEEAKQHNAKVTERVQELKQRLKEDVEAIRETNRERHEQAAQRHEELQEAIRDKAVKHAMHIEEVLFVSEMSKENKAMRIETRNSESESILEARKEEQKLIAKERTEAREAVLERNKELSQQKVDKAKERELQRQEQVKRLEEQKKNDAESRQVKSGERERKLLDHKQAAAAEAEVKKLKAEERILKSQQNRDEQRASDAAKRREKDQKTKERLAEPVTKTTVSEVMAKETPAEEELANTRLTKASNSIARHAKLFVEQYQKDCPLGIKDVNKSKFRALSTRLVAANNSGNMARQVLNDMNSFLTPIDHEYARYFNLFEQIMVVMTDARKATDHGTFRLCSDFLHKLLLDATEGPASARYFVRAGHLVPLVAMIHEEIKTLQKHNRSAALTLCFSLLQCCVQCIVADASSNVKLAPIRDQLTDLLEAAGVDKFCFAIASTCVDVDDMACLQYALMTLQLQIFLMVKRRADTTEWYQTATVSLFTLLQNILNPGGVRAKDDAITHNTMLVILSSFRLLNIIARHRSSVIGNLLREQESARMELFHMVGAFFGYVSRNETAVLERIPQQEGAQEASISKTFEDALQFGMTLQSIPRAHLPSYNMDGTGFTPAPSSARSSVSQTSTVHNSSGKGITRAAIHELLLFIGIAATGEPKVQEIFSWGKDKPLLQVILTALNINYFNKGKHILFPTVLAVIARDDRNRIIAEREMDCKSLFDFLIGEVQCLPQKQQKKIKSSEVAATPQAGPASSPIAPPPLPEGGAKKIFAFNWADMSDDDDDDEAAPAAEGTDASAATNAPASAPSAENALQAKKDKMLQLVKNATNYNIFFRIENRIPRAMWSDIGRFLEESAE